MTQQAAEIALGARALGRRHGLRQPGDVVVQPPDLVEDGRTLAFGQVGEPLRLTFKWRVPVDALAGRVDFGNA